MLLEMSNIDKSFFGVRILKQVGFNLKAGEVHAFLGANGAGKSTLIKIISGAYSMDSGSVKIDGQEIDMSRHSPEAAFALGIFTIYQNFHLIPHLSVAENICLTDLSTGGKRWLNWGGMHKKAKVALAAIGLDIRTDILVKNLTVSQQQMLEIAIALSQNARIIIMDEPTAAISPKEAEKLFELIREIKGRGVGIIYISHRMEEIEKIADRVTVLRDGMNIGTLDVAQGLDIATIAEMIAGREVKTGRRPRVAVPGGEYLRIENMKVYGFGHEINLTARKGEILGLTGLVGAGKSEFARAMFGADRAEAGKLYLEGKAVDIETPYSAIKGGLGFLPEDRDTSGLCMVLSLKDNITLTAMAQSESTVFSVANERAVSGRFRKDLAIKSVNLDQQVRYLSGGNKQKVIFAKWLTANCRFLILDEPTIGIDVGAREEIYRLIEEFVASGKSVLLVSSDFDEILAIADRVVVMSRGRITAILDPEKTSKPEIISHCLGVNDKTLRDTAGVA